MRIGLFGGSFNPIHFGHLRAVEEVREALALDIVYFIPAASPPHKPEDRLAPPDHRLRMVQLATKGNRHFMVSDVELRRGGRSFTIDTVRHFHETTRGKSDFFLQIGMDQFTELETWRECEALASLCNVVVHTRENNSQDEPTQASLAMLGRLGYADQNHKFVHLSGHTLSFIKTTFLPISATMIRSRLADHRSIRYLLPADVGDYIDRHGLY